MITNGDSDPLKFGVNYIIQTPSAADVFSQAAILAAADFTPSTVGGACLALTVINITIAENHADLGLLALIRRRKA